MVVNFTIINQLFKKLKMNHKKVVDRPQDIRRKLRPIENCNKLLDHSGNKA